MTYSNDFNGFLQDNNSQSIEFESVPIIPKPTLADEVKLVCMQDVEMKIMRWMWHYNIAYGKLNVIAGNGGLGKSQATIDFAATVSNGGYFPNCDSRTEQGDVILISAEDDIEDTIKPRLVAAGANLSRIYVLDAITKPSEDKKESLRTFDLTKDIERLTALLEVKKEVRLIIIDPISAYLGKTDSHNNSDMRGLLTPLAAMAAKYGVAVLLVTHLSKSQNPDMMARVIGSVGLIAAARSGFVVVKDEKNPDTRYFLPIKNNVGNDNKGYVYHIESVNLTSEIETSKIVWHVGTVDAHKILYPEQDSKPTATNGAKAFLESLLSEKPMFASDIFEEAKGCGYSQSAMQRAKQSLGVVHKKQGRWVFVVFARQSPNI